MGKKSCSVAAFALALTLCAPALAETPVLYPGSRCVAVGKDGAKINLSIATTSAIVTIDAMRDANADSELLRRCVGALSDCRAKDEPDPGWLIATKWGAIGMAVGGAFVLGLML